MTNVSLYVHVGDTVKNNNVPSYTVQCTVRSTIQSIMDQRPHIKYGLQHGVEGICIIYLQYIRIHIICQSWTRTHSKLIRILNILSHKKTKLPHKISIFGGTSKQGGSYQCPSKNKSIL